MNPVMRRIALWLSETFVACALEVIFGTIIEVWNYSVVRYDLPLSCINISETNDETRNENPSNATLDELLQITDNLIDFSQDEIAVQNLAQIGEPTGGNVSECPDVLTPLKELAYTLNTELELTTESSPDVQNVNDSNDIVTTQDGAERIERNVPTDVNEGNYEENDLKEDLGHDHGDSSTYSRHQESYGLLNECEEAESTSIFGIIAGETVEHERDIDGIIREGNSEIGNEIPLNVEHSEVNSASTHVVCFENNAEILPEFHQEVISNKMEEIALDNPDCWPISGSESSLKHVDDSVHNKEIEMERSMDQEVGGMKSFGNKQRRVQFSEEIETFIYEPGKNVHHPCVILKSQINVGENKDVRKSYQSTLIIEEVEEASFQTCVIREQENETASVFQESHDILETMRRVYDEGRAENNSYFSDESDTSDASLERQNRIEDWLQQATEDDKFLLDNMYPICNCSPQESFREGGSKASKTGHGNICFNKAAVTAARKQSKDILDKICKKLFQQKPANRK